MWSATFGLAVVALVLAYPVLWVWMVIDALLREQWEFPGAGANDKLLWVLIMVFAHVTCLVYFFVVFRKVRRGTLPVPAAQAPGTGAAATAVPA
jgi:hypothetical protein